MRKVLGYIFSILIKLNSEYSIEHYLTDESIQLYEQIKETVNCAICLDIPTDPIDCQKCSVTVCSKCLPSNDDNCVLCRQATTFKSSRKTITFLDLLKFKCKYYELGCSIESV